MHFLSSVDLERIQLLRLFQNYLKTSLWMYTHIGTHIFVLPSKPQAYSSTSATNAAAKIVGNVPI